MSTRAGQHPPAGEVFAVTAPAPATSGWTAAYVDAVGRPGRWDPCQPIHYVVNEGWLPPEGRTELTEVLSRIAQVSGLRFVDDGVTDELPSTTRQAYQPARYGARWAPLLIAWVPASTTDLGLVGGVQGVTLAVALGSDGGPSLVSAQVALSADRPLPGGFGPGTTDGEVLQHEMAHAVGLGHVLDPTQVLYPETTNSESVFGAGDRTGLQAVGARPAVTRRRRRAGCSWRSPGRTSSSRCMSAAGPNLEP